MQALLRLKLPGDSCAGLKDGLEVTFESFVGSDFLGTSTVLHFSCPVQ